MVRKICFGTKQRVKITTTIKVKSRGKLYVRYGPMGGDKTTWLIRQYVPAETGTFIPNIDHRSGASLKSHNGEKVTEMVAVVDHKQPEQILESLAKFNREGLIKRVLVDEVNFFGPNLVPVIEQIRHAGIDVFLAGLLLDSDLRDFGPTRQVARSADEAVAFFARCDYQNKRGLCHRPAIFNYFKGKKPGQVVVGAFDLYGATCGYHLKYFRTKFKSPELAEEINPRKVWRVKTKTRSKLNYPIRWATRRLDNGRWPWIEIAADSMRVGKTTAVKVLTEILERQGYSVEPSFEDWQHNPYLAKSYADPHKAFLKSQRWFAKKKYGQLRAAKSKGVFIQDLSPEGDYGYALTNCRLGRISQADFEAYDRFYRSLPWEKITAPDLLIYLKASDKVLINRAKKAAREFETIDQHYFLALKQTNREWLKKVKKKWNVLEINTNKINFADNRDHKREFADRVIDSLKIDGWL
jgi:deoxyadenosine/deoxycytidine kinase/thymidine kinase